MLQGHRRPEPPQLGTLGNSRGRPRKHWATPSCSRTAQCPGACQGPSPEGSSASLGLPPVRAVPTTSSPGGKVSTPNKVPFPNEPPKSHTEPGRTASNTHRPGTLATLLGAAGSRSCSTGSPAPSVPECRVPASSVRGRGHFQPLAPSTAPFRCPCHLGSSCGSCCFQGQAQRQAHSHTDQRGPALTCTGNPRGAGEGHGLVGLEQGSYGSCRQTGAKLCPARWPAGPFPRAAHTHPHLLLLPPPRHSRSPTACPSHCLLLGFLKTTAHKAVRRRCAQRPSGSDVESPTGSSLEELLKLVGCSNVEQAQSLRKLRSQPGSASVLAAVTAEGQVQPCSSHFFPGKPFWQRPRG